MSVDMRNMRDRLVYRLGESYGRVKFMWLCQKYGVMPWDEYVPEGMVNEVKGSKRVWN